MGREAGRKRGRKEKLRKVKRYEKDLVFEKNKSLCLF